MKGFNVLDRTLDLKRNYLLEASAGTGKTFSIENIAIRLLIDEHSPCRLEEILIVTFTRAAVGDLKVRIREALLRALHFLKKNLSGAAPKLETSIPDYLLAIVERGPQAMRAASRQLDSALTFFEQAAIFTTHGFCSRMLREYPLEANAPLTSSDEEVGLPPSLIYRCIKDFFRIALTPELVTPGQLDRARSYCKGMDKLEHTLYALLQRGVEITPPDPLDKQLLNFNAAMSALKREFTPDPSKIYADFCLQASAYKGIFGKDSSSPKKEHSLKVKRFAALFNKERWGAEDFDILICDGVYLCDALSEEKRHSKKKPPEDSSLNYPSFIAQCRQLLHPQIVKARQGEKILTIMASRCQQLAREHQQNNSLMHYDDLLNYVHRALDCEPFASKVRSRFKAAIIDEFQDTDPIQWEIFKKLFIANTHSTNNIHLYLVGDPKQSIYGFRQADIYTYLSASETIGDEHHATLDTNYRSSLALIEALNGLFSNDSAPGLITLPRLKTALPYRPVKCGKNENPNPLDDNCPALHFALTPTLEGKDRKLENAEQQYIFPFIAKELIDLEKSGKVTLNQCAILVADRYQATRIGRYLDEQKIHYVAQRSKSIVDSIAFSALKELLNCAVSYQEESSLRIALAGPLIGWSDFQLLSLDDASKLEKVLDKWIPLTNILRKMGFALFYQKFLHSSWHDDNRSVAERILEATGGVELYRELQQLAELLIEKEAASPGSPDRLIDQFGELEKLSKDNDQILKVRRDPAKNGVRITTMHASKGLEYELVFAIGVLKRSSKPSLFITMPKSECGSELLAADSENDERYLNYCRELDAEKIRQLYVAFTRAKQRLYVPIIDTIEKTALPAGTASPIELYLGSLCGTNANGCIESSSLHSSLKTLKERYPITYYVVGNTTSAPKTLRRALSSPSTPTKLLPPPSPNIVSNPKFLHSFTALTAVQNNSRLISRQSPPPSNFDATEKNAHTLPAGSELGIILHAILEKIPFAIPPNAIYSFIEPFVRHTPFAPWQSIVADIILHALQAPLPFSNGSFSLSELPETNSYREHQFLFTATAPLHNAFAKKPGYVKGIIDLIFRHQEKYYILDWKSNWLGPDIKHYTAESLSECMTTHNYNLQAAIYSEALKRYLRLFTPQPFHTIFGGAFYIFLRGLSPRSTTGIWHSDEPIPIISFE